MINYPVLAAVEDIKDFIKACMKDELIAGFDVLASKHKGRSYVIGKRRNSFKVAYTHITKLDSLNPYERAIIFEAIHKACYGKNMDEDDMQNEMVCKSETH